jgi:hypothetical protein
MRKGATLLRRLSPLVAVPALLLLASGGAAPASAQRAKTSLPSPVWMASSCHVPSGHGPGYDASIGVKQDGETLCIKVGETLLVLLTAPSPNGPRWGHIAALPPGILGPAPMTLMLSRGATAANFRALKAGTVELTSVRRVCPPAKPGVATCDSMQAWRVTVKVKA